MYHKVTAEQIQLLKEASVAQQAKMFFKLHMKHKRIVQNIWFNQQCVKYNIIPNYIQIKFKSDSIAAKKTEAAAKKIWLREESKFWFVARDSIRIYIKVLHSELSYHLHPVEFDLLEDQVRSRISKIGYQIRIKQTQKLKQLSTKQLGTQNKNNNFLNQTIANFIPEL